MVAIATIQFFLCDRRAVRDKVKTNEHECVPRKLYLQKRGVGPDSAHRLCFADPCYVGWGSKRKNMGLAWHFILESLLVQGLGTSIDLPRPQCTGYQMGTMPTTNHGY